MVPCVLDYFMYPWAWRYTLISFTREKFAGEKIPTLEEAVEECIKLQLTIYFDVKGHPDEVQPTELTNKTSWLCAICPLYFVYLIDLYPANIAKLREHDVVIMMVQRF